MEQVYQIILSKYTNESKHLKKTLPPSNLEYKSNVDNERVQITYTYKSKKNLFIQLFYEGGITDIEIHEEDSRTVSKYTNEYD